MPGLLKLFASRLAQGASSTACRMTFLFRFALVILLAVPLRAAELEVKSEELPRTAPLPPEQAAAAFSSRPGFHAELMAAEPLVEDPVAMAFDEDGRLYVVEMRDYSERRDEKLGHVKLLEDTDGDGRYDKASIFAEGLPWPTAVTCWDGGIFVVASPELLYFKDTDGDRRADVHALVFTGFGNLTDKLNVQALPNSLQWGPDQRIHGALGGNASRIKNFARFNDPPIELRSQDFSFDPRVLDLRAETGGGQWGLSFDDAGRKFVCSNNRHLVQLLYGAGARAGVLPLPPPAVDIAADGPQAEVFRTSPIEQWRILRTQWRVAGKVKGPVEGGGRPGGYFTSACGITIYRGDAFPADFHGDAFVADCGSNLVHRKKLRGEVQLTGTRAPGEERSEFLASRDQWFRPVALANAPDGCLWICDMYREVVEHPWSLPESLKQRLDLNAGNDRGRLWRLVPDGHTARPLPKLGALATRELVPLLAHPNGWHRDTAARLLHQRRDKAVVAALAKLAAESPLSVARVNALRVLRGMEMLDAAGLVRALRDPDADVRAAGVRLCAEAKVHADAVGALAGDNSSRVRFEVGWALAALAPQKKIEPVVPLLERADEPWLRHAAVAAAGEAIEPALAKLAARQSSQLPELRKMLDASQQPAATLPNLGPAPPRAEAVAKFQPALELPGNAAKGRATFTTRCAMCHRFGGEGNIVGPDLDAARASGREKVLGNILEPSREVTAGYAPGIVATKSGDAFSGVIANESPAGITLRLPGGVERFVRAADIAKVERPPRSLMPDGIEAGLSTQEMADLLEFLTAPAPRARLEGFRGLPEWREHRRVILGQMEAVMGPFPGAEKRVALDLQLVEETDCGSYVRRLITYGSEPGSRVPAYLLIPKSALAQPPKTARAILCLHPTDNVHGHRVVVGLAGRAHRQYAAELAERGFVTLAPAYPLLADYQPDLVKLGYASGTMKAIWDNVRALDLLDSLPFVQRGSYGAIGHSLGGHNAVFTAAFDDRIRAVVSSCGLDSFLDYKGGDITGWTSTRYMPRLAEWRNRLHELPFDFDEVLALIAPRGVFVSAPLHDDNFRAASVDRIAAAARQIYALHDAGVALVVEHPDCAHDFPDPIRAKAYEWLSAQLAKPSAP